MTIKQQIQLELKNVLVELGIENIEPKVDYPADAKHGDYSSNVALVAAKKLGRNPIELGENIAQQLTINNSPARNATASVAGGQLTIFEKIEVVKPGFINFSLTSEFLVQKVLTRHSGEDEGRLQNLSGENEIDPEHGQDDASLVGKKVVIEYSSPNIAKPFTIGHLRSTIIGDAVSNLLEATSWEVHRDNHVGDWGTQFGKQIYAIKEWGDEDKIASSKRPVKLLVELYVKFHSEAEKKPELEDKAREWFKKLENGDSEARDLWQKCIDWSWKEFDAIYKELGVPSREDKMFENNGRGYGESYFENKMEPVIEELEDKKLLTVGKEGAKIVEFDESAKLPPLMILKKDGATLYATRDLATDKFRIEKYGSDVLIINEVGMEQSLYFQQLYALELKLGWFKIDQRVHLKHGLIRFKEGKMSTRKGNTIWLDDVLKEAEERAFNLQKHETEFLEDGAITTNKKAGEAASKHVMGAGQRLNIASMVGIGAIKWNDLKRDSKQDIMFDWDEILNMQGNSGPYIQYVFARTQSVLAKSEIRSTKSEANTKYKILNTKYEFVPEERELLRLLIKYDEVIEEAAARFAPNIVCNYLFELAQAFNLFYQKCPIIKSEGEIRNFRLNLTAKTGEIIKSGLYLLGIEAPSKM